MKKQIFLLWLLGCTLCSAAQTDTSKNLYFVSDTQQPMFVEKLVLKPDHNRAATQDIFNAILKEKPSNVYMLGDVVSLGYARHKWKRVDVFLDSCSKENIGVCGVLGNHEVMVRKKRGERNFQKRFAMNVSTGYLSVADSIGVVLLNSNFNALSAQEQKKQDDWYKATMQHLDSTDAIKAIIVCCHHAPYTNSKIVKGSTGVQQQFVPAFIHSPKAQLFITGHAHAFEHFKVKGKDFVVIGGGGGLHQPLHGSDSTLTDLAAKYKPMFHYLTVKRTGSALSVTSHYLKNDFSGFETGLAFNTNSLTGDTIHKGNMNE